MSSVCTTRILPGSKIVGTSGAILVVDRVEGKDIFCGDRRIALSAVVRVLPPPGKPRPLEVGEMVNYWGDRYQQPYGGIPLKLVRYRDWKWICQKPDGRYTTDLDPKELRRIDKTNEVKTHE
jgi:hypothetical protein